MEKEEPVKKKKRRKKKRKKDMGSFFFNLTQLTMLCIFIGVCFVIFQTGYIQKIFQLHILMLFHVRSNDSCSHPCTYLCRSLSTQHINSRSRLHIIADHHRVTSMQMIVGTDIIPYLLFIILAPVAFLLRIPHCFTNITISQ